MPIPKNVTFVTFDVYGTLIDWETGIYEAFAKEAERDGIALDRAELIALFHEVSREIEAGSYELYAEVLRRTALEIAKRLEWPLETSRSGFLPDSVQRWKPFKESNIQLQKLAKKYKLGLLSNIDDKLLGQTRRHIPDRLRPRRHRAAGALLQARTRALHRVRAARRRQERLGPRRLQPLPRRRALPQAARAGDLGQSHQGDARSLAEEADRRGPQPARGRQAAGSLVSARAAGCAVRARLDSRVGGAGVRAVALHPDVLVATSAIWQTNCVVVRGGEEAFRDRLADPARRARGAAGAVEQAGFPAPSGLLATHGDWDHLLGRLAFPGLALGCAETHRGAPARGAG